MKRLLPCCLLPLCFGFFEPEVVREEEPEVVWIEESDFARGTQNRDILRTQEECVRDERASRCSPSAFLDETPQRMIHLTGFGIDRFEVSQRKWRGCVRAGYCPPIPWAASRDSLQGDALPVVLVSWEEAQQFCRYVGGRLPTEAEWEFAARGRDRRRFPWGTNFFPQYVNIAQPLLGGLHDGYFRLAPVNALADGRSPYGLHHMGGNVMEWVSDAYGPDFYHRGPRLNPHNSVLTGLRVVRGGSWNTAIHRARVTSRHGLPEGHRYADLGFRCAYDAPSEPGSDESI